MPHASEYVKTNFFIGHGKTVAFEFKIRYNYKQGNRTGGAGTDTAAITYDRKRKFKWVYR